MKEGGLFVEAHLVFRPTKFTNVLISKLPSIGKKRDNEVLVDAGYVLKK